MELSKDYDFQSVEPKWQAYWEEQGIYRFDETGSGPVFSVDTPPPYVSAAHLHVGHAMSYAQAEFVVRYQRMKGRRVFYPMGFDDNGLPTERYVEKKYNIKAPEMARAEFVKLCLEETRTGAEGYKKLWRSLGLSVDWRETYSTIDPRCQRTAQQSFVMLAQAGLVERRSDPIQWCPACRTALAQADLEPFERSSKIHDIAFRAESGGDLVISTTRPELLPACVALYCNPQDERYRHLHEKNAVVPLFDHKVPVKTSEAVDKEFGTGLMMVCTFGDAEDIDKWRKDGLALRLALGPDGKMNELAGPFKGQHVDKARGEVVKALEAAGFLRGSKKIEQTVSVHERCSTPIEFHVAPQWFIKVVENREAFLKRGNELTWFPDNMKVRYDDWVSGLKWDWNISRQRHYGVPFPVWYCEKCAKPTYASVEELPVDPLAKQPSKPCACGHKTFTPERDVMDTWMTSSMTPFINANWAMPDKNRMESLYPMSVRVQAYEIIRTWLFYTVVKGHYHTNSVPWKSVMISGWGLNEQGKKISKRDLESTKPGQFNRYDPYQVIQQYGADSLRYWATRASLGNNLRYSERDVKEGKRLSTKLWNASRFALMQLEGFDPKSKMPLAERTSTDRWVLHHLAKTIEKATESFEICDFAPARDAIDRFFWHNFCDYYLEMIKDRFWSKELYSDDARRSAQITLHHTLRQVLGVYAVFLPHITEELYQKIYQPLEGKKSIHLSAWPVVDKEALEPVEDGERLVAVLGAIRAERAAQKLANSARIERLTLDCPPDWKGRLEAVLPELKAAARAAEIVFGPAETTTGVENLRLNLLAAPNEATT